MRTLREQGGNCDGGNGTEDQGGRGRAPRSVAANHCPNRCAHGGRLGAGSAHWPISPRVPMRLLWRHRPTLRSSHASPKLSMYRKSPTSCSAAYNARPRPRQACRTRLLHRALCHAALQAALKASYDVLRVLKIRRFASVGRGSPRLFRRTPACRRQRRNGTRTRRVIKCRKVRPPAQLCAN